MNRLFVSSYAILLSAATFSAPLYAVYDFYIDEWATHLTPSLKKTLEKTMTEEPITLVSQGLPTAKNLGLNFPRVLPPLRSALKEINTRFTTQKKRPLMFDPGAGWAYASWKIIVGGGKVIPLEYQKSVAEKMGLSLKKAVPYLQEGETLKDVVPTQLVGNVLDFEGKAYTYSYDGSYSANFFHFLEPDQITQCVKKLYDVTNPGGFAVASVVAPSAQDPLVDVWNQQKSQEKPNPGLVTCEITEISRAGAETKVVYTGAHPFQQGVDPDISNTRIIFQEQRGQDTHTYKHLTGHYIDPDTLSKFFTQAGFTVENAYYYDSTYEKESQTHSTLSTNALKEKMARFSGIFARKPVVQGKEEDKK
ncbi:MAG: hypothetical protein HYX35_06375 [Proteobacteria bacterium]|nr:hypothetical protein [Pseudomonadota bacterium]